MVSSVKIREYQGKSSQSPVAFVDVVLDDKIKLYGLPAFNNDGQLHVADPKKLGKDGKPTSFRECRILDYQLRDAIDKAATSAWLALKQSDLEA